MVTARLVPAIGWDDGGSLVAVFSHRLHRLPQWRCELIELMPGSRAPDRSAGKAPNYQSARDRPPFAKSRELGGHALYLGGITGSRMCDGC
jgi:hypothetical protein